jgi:uncharacterized membrane protein
MDPSVPLHPVVVHTPIAFVVASLAFDLVGRATDSEWWRKGAFAMLVVGMLGAGAALLSGERDADRARQTQGIPGSVIEPHESAGKIALWVTVGAVAARALAGASGTARGAVGVVALLLHLAAVAAVGVAGVRGGELVYRHGAGVSVQGEALRWRPAGETPGATATGTGTETVR